MMDPGRVSRDSRPPSSVRGGTRGGRPMGYRPAVSCNRCRAPMTAKCIYSTCGCLFCEKCVDDHFNQYDHCPICNVQLKREDINEMNILNPSIGEPPLVASMQALLVKNNSNEPKLFLDSIAKNVVNKIDNLKREVKFVVKQYLRENKVLAKHASGAGAAAKKARQDMEAMKQSRIAKEQQLNDIINQLEARAQAQEAKNSQLRQQLAEKEKMIQQFREHCGTMTVQSPRNHNMDNGSRSFGGGGSHSQIITRPPLRERRYEPPSQGLIKRPLPPPQDPIHHHSYQTSGTNSFCGDSVAGSSNSGSAGRYGPGGVRTNLRPGSGFQFSSGGLQHINKKRRVSASSSSAQPLLRGGGYGSSSGGGGASNYSGTNNWARM